MYQYQLGGPGAEPLRHVTLSIEDRTGKKKKKNPQTNPKRKQFRLLHTCVKKKKKQQNKTQNKEWFQIPFLHSVRNCKVHTRYYLHKKK